MSNQILVTGATGNVGGEVMRQLLAAGITPRVAVRSLSKAEALKAVGAEPVELDFQRPETLEPAFAGVEKVFWASPLTATMADLDRRTLVAAQKAGVQQIVRLSVMGAELDTALGRAHRQVEQQLEASGLAYTILRPNSFHQNYITYTGATIKSDHAFYLPLGDGKISFVDIRDVAAIAVHALTEPGHTGETYLITGGEALSNTDVAAILSRVLGQTIAYVDIPEATARQAMQAAGIPDADGELVLSLYAAQKTGQYATISPVVEQITGKQPIRFAQFAQDSVAAFV